MKRVAALVVAVVMVVAALLVRTRIDDENDTDGTAHLVCAEELRDACLELDDAVGGLEVTIEPAGATFARLTAIPNEVVDDPGLDGWLVPQPWPGMVDVQRAQDQLRPLFASEPTRLARSPLVIVARDDRADVLADGACGTVGVEWPCLGDVAGQDWDQSDIGGSASWGRVKVGHSSPITSAAGLLVLAQATSEYFERTEYSSTDELVDSAYLSWLERLEGAGQTSPAPVNEMLGAFPTAVFDFVGTTEAEAAPALRDAAPARREAFTLLYPLPVGAADVVLALSASDGRDQDIADLAGGGTARDALAGDGWRVEDEPLAPGLDPDVRLDAGSNLPTDAGIYLALQRTWEQVT